MALASTRLMVHWSHDNDIMGNGEDGLRLDDEGSDGTINSLVRSNTSSSNGGHAAHQCGSICTGNEYINNWFYWFAEQHSLSFGALL